MSNPNIPPGLIQPTVAALPPGASNPKEAALIEQQNANDKLNNMNKIAGGKRRYRGGGDVAVPQFQMQYTPTGGPGTNPNDIIANSSSTSMQSTAWASQDSQATKMGGRRRKRTIKGGESSELDWGCYSGGKRYTKNRRNKTRSLKRKTRRYRRRR